MLTNQDHSFSKSHPCHIIVIILSFVFSGFGASAQAEDTATVATYSSDISPAVDLPPITLLAVDTDNDNGGSITISWDDAGYSELPQFRGYEILRRSIQANAPVLVGTAPHGSSSLVDKSVSDDTTYVYYVAATVGEERFVSDSSSHVQSTWQIYNTTLTPLLIALIIVGGSVIFFIETAKRGRKLFLRKIAGLEAVNEAVGRATEMGRPILFVAGIADIDDVQTIAGLTILGRLGRTIAEYDTKITMPTRTSLVMTAGRETLREAYMAAGRPDAYSDDMVFYVSDEQFGFAAAVDGILVRDKPAACFYLGTFHAESLIMAETGNLIGAIQIAGTAQPAQLPFFVAACDYTLIGEELFAASAYLSEEPRQLGSLKGQDVGKAVAMMLILAGVLIMTLASMWELDTMNQLQQLMRDLFSLN
ncbi:MAG: fibronectin type III domain-containing protein [candidate division Zixibacteria bacterium]|nr:fibronectin type III domain-containing protein [candidate division Zixibacteria bacterium]